MRGITPPTDFTEQAMETAVSENIDSVLFHEMSRFAYARAAVSSVELPKLPPLHLMDHRLRLPRLEIAENDTAEQIRQRFRQRLSRMLVASQHPGGRELVQDALRSNLEGDSLRLVEASRVSPAFVDFVLRGRLGSARELIPRVAWGQIGEDGARAIVRQMLAYHGAFQVQLIAAKGQCVDRLPLRLVRSPKGYSEAEACNHLCDVLEAIEKIVEKLSGEVTQPPQRAIIADRKLYAAEHRTKMQLPDDQIVAQAATYFSKRRDVLQELLRRLREIKKKATGQSLHKALFGVTSVEALIFACTRLIQLQRCSEVMVRSPTDALNKYIPVDTHDLPTIDNPDVAKLLFAYRALILQDDAKPRVTGDDGRNIDLAVAWKESASIELPGFNTIKKRSRYLKTAGERQFLSLPIGKRMCGAQRIDVLPEFLLQRFPGVGGVLPGSSPLVRVKKKREQEQRTRPPNVRRASKRAARP